MKTIKINIVDMYSGFDRDNHWLTKSLSKYYKLEFSDEPDFLFYSCFGNKHLAYKNCVKIFLTGENALPNFNECDYGQGFDYLDFGDRYFRKNYQVPSPIICDRSDVSDDMLQRKFCNFIYSNANRGEGAHLRQEFCKKLMEYKHVDCPGRVLNNMSADDLEPRDGNWSTSKQEFLKKYKFTIAFENSASNGYTTEKLFQPLYAFSIPIYYGNPLVVRDFNPKAFINCNDYNNDWDAIIERVRELDNDQDKYLAMLRENPMQPDFDFNQQDKLEKWLCAIIERGNTPINKDPCDWEQYRQYWAQDALKKENEQLKQSLADICKPHHFEPLKVRTRGNFLCRRIEKGGYVKTYICGLRVGSRPINLVKFIDKRLEEMERRLTAKLVLEQNK